MKIPCEVKGKTAVIIDFCQGKKGQPTAIVIVQGKLKAVQLCDIVLGELPEQISAKPKLREVVK